MRKHQRSRACPGFFIYMSKRFHDTEIWKQDWFLELPYEYKFLWWYIKDTCNHAGIWKPNTKFIEFVSEKPIDLKKAASLFNSDKGRVEILSNGRWLIPDFIAFQYGPHLNPNNRVHLSVLGLLEANEVNLTSIRGLLDLKDRVKDKDKDKDKDIQITASPKIYLDMTSYKWVNINPEHKIGWLKAYPAVSIDIELAKMAVWIKANPDKKKIRWERFIVNWLNRAQDAPVKGGKYGTQTSNATNKGLNQADNKQLTDKYAHLATTYIDGVKQE